MHFALGPHFFHSLVHFSHLPQIHSAFRRVSDEKKHGKQLSNVLRHRGHFLCCNHHLDHAPFLYPNKISSFYFLKSSHLSLGQAPQIFLVVNQVIIIYLFFFFAVTTHSLALISSLFYFSRQKGSSFLICKELKTWRCAEAPHWKPLSSTSSIQDGLSFSQLPFYHTKMIYCQNYTSYKFIGRWQVLTGVSSQRLQPPPSCRPHRLSHACSDGGYLLGNIITYRTWTDTLSIWNFFFIYI